MGVDPLSDEEISKLFEFVQTPRTRRSSSTRRTSREVKGRVGNLPESRSVRVTLRGTPQTSWWRAQRVAEKTLVERRATPEELDEHRRNRDQKRTNEEITARVWKAKPGMWEEEKQLDILQQIKNEWL